MTGGFWQWIERWAERRDARRAILIDKGLDWRSMVCKGLTSSDPRFLIALAIIALFAWAFARESDSDTRKLMIGALIAAFAGAWGYYLGSSSTASRANDRADAGVQLAHEALRQLPAPPKAVERAANEVADAAVDRAEEIAGEPPARP